MHANANGDITLHNELSESIIHVCLTVIQISAMLAVTDGNTKMSLDIRKLHLASDKFLLRICQVFF